MKKQLLPLVGLSLLLGLSVITGGFKNLPGREKSLNPEEAKEKALTFIKKNLVSEDIEAEIKEISEEDGLYKLKVGLPQGEVFSYMTKEGSLFFPQGIEIKREVVEEEESETEQVKEIPKQEKPEVLLFTMAFCSFGNQAEDLMKPVVDLLGNTVEIEPHYIFYENYRGGGPEYCIDEESKYCSMHGASEAREDIRELCVYKGQRNKYWDFISQVNEKCTADDVDTCWKEGAAKAKVDTAAVEACVDKDSLSFAKSEKELTDKLDVQGSPSLVINGVKYQGERNSEAYKNAICSGFQNPPQACEKTLSAESPGSSGSCQ